MHVCLPKELINYTTFGTFRNLIQEYSPEVQSVMMRKIF